MIPWEKGLQSMYICLKKLELSVFLTETRSFFFWQGNQSIMRRRILIRWRIIVQIDLSVCEHAQAGAAKREKNRFRMKAD